MQQQLSDVRSLGCLLGETNRDEVLGPLANCYFLIEINRLVDNVHEILLTGNLKRVRFKEHLVENHTYRPNIDAFVVLIPNQNLRT